MSIFCFILFGFIIFVGEFSSFQIYTNSLLTFHLRESLSETNNCLNNNCLTPSIKKKNLNQLNQNSICLHFIFNSFEFCETPLLMILYL